MTAPTGVPASASPQAADPLLLPPGACLLHIGPYKTGSTTVQRALHEARPQLAGHGVVYPGQEVRQLEPGFAVLGFTPRGRRPIPYAVWEEMVAEVRAAADRRVVVSTEDFGSAGPPRIARIVEGLGRERLHVVAVARRLDQLLPSQWQERVKSHETLRFEEWLGHVLGDDPDDPEHRRFWSSHDLVRTAERWAAAVGRDRFTIVVGDDAEPQLLLRTFERLLGLPDGFLAAAPSANRSLSANATELLRRLNGVFAERGWADGSYHRLLHRGAMHCWRQRERSPLEVPIPPLPPWAQERAAARSRALVEGLHERGVRFVGDPERLLVEPPAPDAGPAGTPPPEVVAMDTVVEGLAALLDEAANHLDNLRAKVREREAATAGGPPLAQVPGRVIARELVRRGGAGVRAGFRGRVKGGVTGTVRGR